MHRLSRAGASALVLALLLGACSSPSAPTSGPGATTLPPAATAAGGQPTSGAAAGEPCSFLTAEQVAAVVGTTPVEVAERAGRGDCDYWLDAAKTTKVNVGVTPGAAGLALFESTKALGETLPTPTIGDESYMLQLQGLGTLVMVRQGDAVAAIQVLTAREPAEESIMALALARAVVEGL